MGVACWCRPYIENDYLLVWSATETSAAKAAERHAVQAVETLSDDDNEDVDDSVKRGALPEVK